MRPIRPGVVVAGLLAAGFAAAIGVVWHQGEFLRASAANYLRERLAAEFGAQFQTSELRGRWFPPGLSLGPVTFERHGKPWVLTAEDVRISFNPYAIIFGRERLGHVVIERPRLFVRSSLWREGSAPAPGAGAPLVPQPLSSPAGGTALAPAAVGRLRSFLRPPLLFRVLEVVDGRIDILGAAGARTVATGVNFSVLVSRGSARALLEAGSVTIERDTGRWGLGGLDADVTLEEGRALVSGVSLSGGQLSGSLRGTIDYAGTLALDGDLSARLEDVATLAGRPGAAAGAVTVTGGVTGSWSAPAGAATLAVQNPTVAGRRLPNVSARLGWRDRRLSWQQLRMAVGDGLVSADGEADFAGAAPRYRVSAEARDVEPAQLPAVPAGIVGKLGALTGKLEWEGSGTGRGAVGAGSLQARFSVPTWPGDPLAVEAEASLESGRLSVGSFRVAGRTLEADGSGSWQRDAGFAGTLRGAVGDIQALAPPGRVAIGGVGSFQGQIAADAAGARFVGAARIGNGSVGALAGIEAGARVVLGGGAVRIEAGELAWPGGRGSLAGTVGLAGRSLELDASFQRFALSDAVRLFGADPRETAGNLTGRLRVRGTIADPEVGGEVSGESLSYRAVAADSAALSLSYAGRRLEVGRLLLRRGGTQLSFRGELREGRELDGSFESPAFDLADLGAFPGLELTGALTGKLGGRLDAPHLEAAVRAGRLRYAGFDLKGGELAVDYRGGTAAVQGWIGAQENRVRLVVEPARAWRFDSELELAQFAPEMVRSGLGGLPPALSRALGRTSFLAAGRLKARGQLKDAASIRADVWLDSLWVQSAGQSLQNLAPVRISWRDGGVAVEDFRIAGEQYHFQVSGGGSPAAGWDLQASGAVNLSAFREYWTELEDVDGIGELRLAVGGPWSAPRPEGTLAIREALVRVRSLPEALEHLEGRLELRDGTLTAAGLTGTLGDGAFRGGGSYRFGDDQLDAHVEGRLDLSLFRERLPAARDLRGPLDVRLRLLGAIAAPALSGEVDVIDAEMFLRPFPAKITNLRGKVAVTAERLEVRGIEGQTGSGTVRVDGILDWSRSPARVEAQLQGRGIQLSLAGALKVQSDVRLGLRGDFQDLNLAGEVRVLKARYLREFGEPAPKLQAGAAEPGAPDGGPNLSRMALDVKVTATDNVWISNRMAKIEAAAALSIGGRLGAPVISGEIAAIQGEAYYLSRKFRLESASLRFVPPSAKPVLDLQASTSVGDTQILFLLDGPLGKLSYRLTSLPALSQQDIIALLTIGETRSSLERGGERASTAGAAAFTAEPLVNALGDEARSSMGLEVLQLEPVIGENQQVSARVTLGTHLSDRLFVSYSQTLGATEDQQVAVQYSLLDYLSVWGQELRQGIYSLDLVFRYALK